MEQYIIAAVLVGLLIAYAFGVYTGSKVKLSLRSAENDVIADVKSDVAAVKAHIELIGSAPAIVTDVPKPVWTAPPIAAAPVTVEVPAAPPVAATLPWTPPSAS